MLMVTFVALHAATTARVIRQADFFATCVDVVEVPQRRRRRRSPWETAQGVGEVEAAEAGGTCTAGSKVNGMSLELAHVHNFAYLGGGL